MGFFSFVDDIGDELFGGDDGSSGVFGDVFEWVGTSLGMDKRKEPVHGQKPVLTTTWAPSYQGNFKEDVNAILGMLDTDKASKLVKAEPDAKSFQQDLKNLVTENKDILGGQSGTFMKQLDYYKNNPVMKNADYFGTLLKETGFYGRVNELANAPMNLGRENLILTGKRNTNILG